MFRKLICLGLVFVFSAIASAGTYQWKSIASGNWETASNWTTGIAPTIFDTAKAQRNDGGTTVINVTTSGQAAAAGLLVKLGFTTLNINSACNLSINGPIEIFNGGAANINVNGTLNGASTCKLGGGGAIDTVNVYGIFNLHNDANNAQLTMGFSAGGIATLNIQSGGVANIDTYTWSGLCTSLIDIKSGGTLNLKGDVRTQVNADIAAGRIVGNRNVGNVTVTYDGVKTILQSSVMNSITPGEFITDPATLHCLGFRWYVNGDDNGDATVQVTYKETGTQQWRQALNLLRVNRERVDRDYLPYTCENLFAGSVMGLEPATSYDVNLVLVDPNGGQATQNVTVQTRAVPSAPAPTRTLHVYPPGWSSSKNQPSYDSLNAAFTATIAGDKLLLYPGVHSGNVILSVIGTANAPVVITSAGPEQAIISGNDTINSGKNVTVTGSEYIFIEDVTIQGGLFGIFGGNTNTPAGTKNLVIRNCLIVNAGTGIYGWSQGSKNWYISDNFIFGRNPYWTPRDYTIPSDDDGIRVYGQGHVVCYNHIEKFWDCLGVANIYPPDPNRQLKCSSIDMYGNDLSQALDDCLETDFACHNIRVWGNKMRDSQNGVTCQPIYGGPIYIFRNDLVGFNEAPYKVRNWATGIYIFNNTSVVDAEGWVCDPIWQNATIRNNLILGTKNYSMETGSPDPRTTLDYNGYRKTDDPTRFIKWYLAGDWSGAFIKSMTLAEFYANNGFEQHGIMFDYDAFVKCPVPVLGQTHYPNDYDLRLAASSMPIDKGLVIPTINETYNGSAPDIGCYEYGEPLPHYGPRGSDCTEVAGDLNIDNIVDITDVGLLAAQWLQSSCSETNGWCSGADIDNSSDVNFVDYALQAQNWQKTGNCAPTVYAGADQMGYLLTVNLVGVASDDGLPNPPGTVTTHWTLRSGPGTVTFGNENSLSTTATLSTNGTYVLRLTANDGDIAVYDEVTILIVTAPQWSTTGNYYIDGFGGSDLNAGTSAAPFKTISKAISMGGTGKTLLVWGGQTYNELLTFTSNSTNLKRDPASGEAIINAGGLGEVIFTSKSNCIIDGFTITNGTNGIHLLNSSSVGCIVKNCRIKNNTNHGVLINKGQNITVNNCAIYSNGSSSDYANIYALQTGASGTVTQCTIYGGFVGVCTSHSNASITTLRDCIISGTSSNAIVAETGTSISSITYCDVVGSTSGVTLGDGCTTGDPMLHNPASGDFNLDSGTAAHPSSDGGDMGYRYSTSGSAL